MQKENKTMDLILNFAKSDKNIQAVWMNGSRVNPNVKKDEFQDYDIVFAVNDIAPFIKDKSWIANFGETVIIQEPRKNDLAIGIKSDFSRIYRFLMLFNDSNRIDLTFVNKNHALEEYKSDSLTVLLLDKDNFLPALPKPNDSDYHIRKPTEKQFEAYCNEFWWCLQNVAKGIVRDELTYAIRMFDIVHAELEKMVEWYIGMQNNFEVSTGKFGKYFKYYLPKNLYEMYKETYSGSNYENLWDAVFKTCDLFRVLAKEVAVKLSFTYNQSEDDGITKYLEVLRSKINVKN